MTKKKQQKPAAPIQQNGSSACPVCGNLVVTHKYVQFIPLRPAEDGERVVCDHDGCKMAVPRFSESLRVDGKRFICLAHEPEEIREAIESLDWSIPWELRHCPAGGVLQKVVVYDATAAVHHFECMRRRLVESLLR